MSILEDIPKEDEQDPDILLQKMRAMIRYAKLGGDIHWLAFDEQDSETGIWHLVVVDTAHSTPGIRFNLGNPSHKIPEDLFKAALREIRDWLWVQIPESHGWEIEHLTFPNEDQA
jgi:hypothetical protein